MPRALGLGLEPNPPTTAIPEPPTVLLGATGLLALIGLARFQGRRERFARAHEAARQTSNPRRRRSPDRSRHAAIVHQEEHTVVLTPSSIWPTCGEAAAR